PNRSHHGWRATAAEADVIPSSGPQLPARGCSFVDGSPGVHHPEVSIRTGGDASAAAIYALPAGASPVRDAEAPEGVVRGAHPDRTIRANGDVRCQARHLLPTS